MNTLGTIVIIMALAAALVGAGALSVLSFPLVAGRLAATNTGDSAANRGGVT